MMFNRKITQNCHCEPLGEAIQPIETDVNRHKATGTNSCNHLITQSLSHLITSKAAAFTLAEVLITLAVIGIVAVLTIPNLMQNNNQKAWDTAADVFNKRLEVAARVMNTQETLAIQTPKTLLQNLKSTSK